MSKITWAQLCKNMSPAFLKLVEDNSLVVNVDKGEVIYFQTDPAQYLYVVLNGYVRTTYITFEGDVFLYSILSRGDTFGETGFHGDQGHAETASAKSSSSLLKVKISALSVPRYESEKDKLIAYLLTDKYQQVLNITRCLLLTNLEQRLAYTVLYLAERLSVQTTHEGGEYKTVPSVITQSDLGAMVRGNRVNVNRILNKWQRLGYIISLNRSILIFDQEVLTKISTKSSEL